MIRLPSIFSTMLRRATRSTYLSCLSVSLSSCHRIKIPPTLRLSSRSMALFRRAIMLPCRGKSKQRYWLMIVYFHLAMLLPCSLLSPSVARAFSKFMIAKPEHIEPAWQVNETLNVFCRVLHDLGPELTKAFFQDRIGWLDYTRLVLNTPRYYPKIYTLAFKTVSLAEGIGWISAWLQLGRQASAFALWRLMRPLWYSLSGSLAMRTINKVLPRVGLRLAVRREAMEQVRRGSKPDKRKKWAIGYWLGRLWPQG